MKLEPNFGSSVLVELVGGPHDGTKFSADAEKLAEDCTPLLGYIPSLTSDPLDAEIEWIPVARISRAIFELHQGKRNNLYLWCGSNTKRLVEGKTIIYRHLGAFHAKIERRQREGP